MAVALGVAVSGPRSYGGVMTDQPFVHAEGRRDAGPDDIDAAVRLLWRVWGLMLALVVVAAILA
jgi:adenosylcobinamide-phosphate synthase